jgi:hypothetical protein
VWREASRENCPWGIYADDSPTSREERKKRRGRVEDGVGGWWSPIWDDGWSRLSLVDGSCLPFTGPCDARNI